MFPNCLLIWDRGKPVHNLVHLDSLIFFKRTGKLITTLPKTLHLVLVTLETTKSVVTSGNQNFRQNKNAESPEISGTSSD